MYHVRISNIHVRCLCEQVTALLQTGVQMTPKRDQLVAAASAPAVTETHSSTPLRNPGLYEDDSEAPPTAETPEPGTVNIPELRKQKADAKKRLQGHLDDIEQSKDTAASSLELPPSQSVITGDDLLAAATRDTSMPDDKSEDRRSRSRPRGAMVVLKEALVFSMSIEENPGEEPMDQDGLDKWYSQIGEQYEEHGIYPGGLSCPPTQLIADSGCKAAVAGEQWHKAYQALLTAHGATWTWQQEEEYYKFGAGPVERSTKRYSYPVWPGEQEREDSIEMSQVSGQAIGCPGLASPDEMKKWKMIFDYGEDTFTMKGQDTWKPIPRTPSGHHAIVIFGDPDPPNAPYRVFPAGVRHPSHPLHGNNRGPETDASFCSFLNFELR